MSLSTLPLLCTGSSAAAQTLDAIEVSWETPSSCPPSPRVLTEARRLLGPDFRQVGEIEVDIEIEQENGSFVLEIAIAGAGIEGERELRMQSCDEVRDAAALLIAISLDPEVAIRAPEPEPEQVASRESRKPAELALVVPGIGIDSALLPSAALLLGVQIVLHAAPLRFTLGGALLWPNDVSVGPTDARFAVDVGAAAARAAVSFALFEADGASLGPCAGIWLGRMWAEVEGRGEDRGELLLAPELGASAEYRLSSLVSLGLRLSALLPLRPPRFELQGGGAIHEAARVSLQAEMALAFHFGLGG